MELTINDKEILTNELINISKRLNGDIIYDFNVSCKNLSILLQDIKLESHEIEKMNLLNTRVNDLKQDTLQIVNEMKYLVSNAKMITK